MVALLEFLMVVLLVDLKVVVAMAEAMAVKRVVVMVE